MNEQFIFYDVLKKIPKEKWATGLDDLLLGMISYTVTTNVVMN